MVGSGHRRYLKVHERNVCHGVLVVPSRNLEGVGAILLPIFRTSGGKAKLPTSHVIAGWDEKSREHRSQTSDSALFAYARRGEGLQAVFRPERIWGFLA